MADEYNKNVRVRIVEDVQRDLNERFHLVAYDMENGSREDMPEESFADRPAAVKSAQKRFGKDVEVVGGDEVEDGMVDYPDSNYHKTLAKQEAMAKLSGDN
jgi:hypothetical protein